MRQPLTESPFQLPRVPLSRRHRKCRLIADLPERQIKPPRTDFFFFLSKPAPYVKIFCPIREMRSESREKHEITQMYIYFFHFPCHPLTLASEKITSVPLTLAMFFQPPSRLQTWSSVLFLPFSLPPPSLLLLSPPAHSVPSNFQGTLSRPFQIGLRLNLPCLVSLCASQFHS